MTAATRPAWLAQLATLLRVVADGLDGGNSAVAAKPTKGVIGLTALARVIGPLSRVLSGKGDFADDAQIAVSVMDEIALVFPPSAPTIATLETALAGLAWIVGLYQGGAIKGGIPPSYPPGGGPGPYRGR